MKNRIIRLLNISLIISCMFTMPSFAGNTRPDMIHVPAINSRLLSSDQTYSGDTAQALLRGSLLSKCVLILTNAGRGNIGVVADTMCHKDVDNMYITIYVDRYDDVRDEWVNKKIYEYEYAAKDMVNGKLSAKFISFDITDQPSGYYYRAWAYHEVEKNGVWESMKTGTDGVFITSGP